MAHPIAPIPSFACNAPLGADIDTAAFLRAFAAIGCLTCQPCRRLADPLDSTARQASLDPHSIRTITDAAGFSIDSIHGVFGESIDPSSPDPDHRRLCLQVYEHEARLALDLGSPMVVVHPAAINPGKQILSSQQAAASQTARAPFLMDFLARLAPIGEKLNITFLIENLPFNCASGFDPVAIAASLRAINSSRLRLCLDTGHAHITAGSPAAPSARAVAEAIAACRDVIAYLHIHDNNAAEDSHQTPGDGTIDWRSLSRSLKAANSLAPRMLELFHDPLHLTATFTPNYVSQLQQWLGVA